MPDHLGGNGVRPGALMNIEPGARLLLVASTGGHLAQLTKIAEMLQASLDSTWVTFDSPQSRSLLAKYSDVRYVPYVPPRDIKGILRTIRVVTRIGRSGGYTAAISTGAGIALFLPFLGRRKMRRIYVESVSRVDGPSLTGRVLARIPGLERRTQHEQWSSPRWPFEFTLLDDYQVVPKTAVVVDPATPLSILVTLGTIRPYRFDAVVNAVVELLVPGDRVVWQVGCTTGYDLPGQVVESLGRTELQELAARCDVVISHAGVGTAVDLLDLGIHAVLIPRRAHHAEHVDDHQLQIGSLLGDMDLATVRLPEQLSRRDLHKSAATLVVSRADLGTAARDGLTAQLHDLLEFESGVA